MVTNADASPLVRWQKRFHVEWSMAESQSRWMTSKTPPIIGEWHSLNRNSISKATSQLRGKWLQFCSLDSMSFILPTASSNLS